MTTQQALESCQKSRLYWNQRWSETNDALDAKQREIERLRELLKGNHSVGCLAQTEVYDPQGEMIYGIQARGECNCHVAALSGSPADPPKRLDTARDWTEDAGQENGKYKNRCLYCRQLFIGHKRRVVCKLCNAARSAPVEPAQAAPKCRTCNDTKEVYYDGYGLVGNGPCPDCTTQKKKR